MVRKVCAKNNNYRGYSKLDIDRMVEEVYSNIEVNDAVELNITLNNDVRGSGSKEEDKEANTTSDKRGENRQIRRNGGLNDLIRILILRELLGRPRMLWTKLQTWYGSKASYATKTTFS